MQIFSLPCLDLLNQKHWSLTICALTSSPGDSKACFNLRITALILTATLELIEEVYNVPILRTEELKFRGLGNLPVASGRPWIRIHVPI